MKLNGLALAGDYMRAASFLSWAMGGLGDWGDSIFDRFRVQSLFKLPTVSCHRSPRIAAEWALHCNHPSDNRNGGIMTEWERRPRSDEPMMEQRKLRDDQGRQWIGSVSSGRFEGGEENAEVLFVCEDQPDERKRFASLGLPPAEADDAWRKMGDREVEALFKESNEV